MIKRFLFWVCLVATAFGQTADDVARLHVAAEQGDARAQFSLGGCYVIGNGVKKNPIEAVKWFRKAAEQRVADAQFFLGSYYATGNGVLQDKIKAYAWYALAELQGNEDASHNMNLLAKNELTAAQVERALALARAYQKGDFGEDAATFLIRAK